MSIYKKIKSKFLNILLHRKSVEQLKKMVAGNTGIVFLMYHSTPKHNSDYGYITHKESFQSQITFLYENYDVISVDLANDILFNDKPYVSSKPMAVITFDDGFQDNFDIAYPILKQYNMPFIIFLTSDFIDNENETFMSWDDVNILAKDSSVTLGAHSQSHANLMALAEADQKIEIEGSKIIIESHIDSKVMYFAYPSGGYDQYCLDLVESNYCLGFKDRTNNDDDKDHRKVARVSIDSRHNIHKNFIIELVINPCLQ
jgi:peptidoglycan/xylan/chitin deacetylase (PgdA/CDA1 family)